MINGYVTWLQAMSTMRCYLTRLPTGGLHWSQAGSQNELTRSAAAPGNSKLTSKPSMLSSLFGFTILSSKFCSLFLKAASFDDPITEMRSLISVGFSWIRCEMMPSLELETIQSKVRKYQNIYITPSGTVLQNHIIKPAKWVSYQKSHSARVKHPATDAPTCYEPRLGGH